MACVKKTAGGAAAAALAENRAAPKSIFRIMGTSAS
jgi:hypothetical protein